MDRLIALQKGSMSALQKDAHTHTHREMQLCGPAKGAQACLGTQKGEGKTILAHIGKA